MNNLDLSFKIKTRFLDHGIEISRAVIYQVLESFDSDVNSVDFLNQLQEHKKISGNIITLIKIDLDRFFK